jgi:predicted RNA-binding protein with PUA-like domain
MPNQWLLKTEPSAYSFQRLQQEKRTLWDGVRNPQALKFLACIRKGDRLLVYHTGNEKAVVGIATALSAAYPDPHAKDAKLLVLDISADKALPRPVPLAAIKADASCSSWELVRLPRLSVMPVSVAQWAAVQRLAGA